jgi:hypothetical protein
VGFLKSKAFETRPADINVVKQRIVEEVNAISANTLSRIMKNMADRLHEYINVN